VEGVGSNLLQTIVMEELCQKSKRPSYIWQSSYVKLSGVQRRMETTKPLQFLQLIKVTFNCGKNTGQQSASVRHHKRMSLDPGKDDFLKLMLQSSVFSRQTQDTGINLTVLFLQHLKWRYYFSELQLSTASK
jgi:hypothetical protein